MSKMSKLEEEYSRFSGMSEEQLTAEKMAAETVLVNINAKISSLTEQMVTLTVAINTLKNSDKEEDKIGMQKKIEKRDQLEAALKEAEELKETNVAKANKKIERIEGLRKNKIAIQKIIAYRDKFIAQADALKEQKTINNQLIANKGKEISDAEKDATKANAKIEAELHIISLKSNKEYTEADANRETKLRNQQAEMKEKINQLKKEKDEFVKANAEIDKKLEKIARAISKCNLAWKALFNNKTWDQIQAKSVNGKLTKETEKQEKNKTADKEEKSEEKSEEKKNENVENKGKIKETIKETVEKISRKIAEQEENKNPEQEEKSSNPMDAEYEELPAKTSKFRTFLSAIRHPIQTVKNWLQNRKDNIKDKEEEELEEPEVKAETKKEEPANSPVNSIEAKRDSFLAQLQKMVEGQEEYDKQASREELNRVAAQKQAKRQAEDREK